jgi:hypothetical protein
LQQGGAARSGARTRAVSRRSRLLNEYKKQLTTSAPADTAAGRRPPSGDARHSFGK